MHVLRATAALVLAAGFSGTALAQGGNLVRNGDFEANGPVPAWLSLHAGSAAIPGWRIGSGYVDLVGRWWQPAGGGSSVEVGSPGPGALEQSVATVPGRRYRLSFALAGNPEGPPRVKTLVVSAGPTSRTFSFDSAGHTRQAMGWRTQTLDFTAAASTTTIGFARTDGSPRSGWWGPAIDDVSLVPLGAAAAPPAAATSAPAAATSAPSTTTSAPSAAHSAAASAPPAKTAGPRSAAAFTPTGSDPYGGLWVGAYPGKALRVYLERHGSQVTARVVDGSPTMPTGRLAWSGRVDRSPPVVLGACSDDDAKGLHGAVIEWVRQTAFQLHIANCHAGDVLYTRWRDGQ
jgi:choice-of-anchor C domain-containing protein